MQSISKVVLGLALLSNYNNSTIRATENLDCNENVTVREYVGREC